MGAAIARGLQNVEIHGTDLNAAHVENLANECGLIPAENAEELASRCDFLVLAVKPQHAQSVCTALAPLLRKEQCLVSICAGLPMHKLAEWTDHACPVVRVMPNTPALVGDGVFAVCLEDDKLKTSQKDVVRSLFDSLGQVHILPEQNFDAFTAVIGSGPAYVFYLMEACIEAAVELGLARPMATQMVEGLFTGSAQLAATSDQHVSVLREMVTSPAGTTVEALIHMDRTAMRANMIDAIRACYERSIELGQ